MEPETRYARSGGLRIAYQVIGEGPDLVMVPGLTSHLEIQWRDPGYRRFVRSLSSFCRLVRFDKRGTGLSDPVAEPPGLDQRVADLKAVISAAKCRRPVVLGFSDGGPVAVALAAAPRRPVRALILYGTSPRRPPGTVMRQQRVMARQWGQGDSLGMFAPTLAGELARHDRGVFERASASPAMIKALVESLTDTDVRSLLAEVAVPVLVLHRRSDFVPFAEARLMTRGISGARLVELEGSDHLPWVGDVSGVVSAMAGFIAEVARRPGQRGAAMPAARPRRPVTGWEALTDAERRVAQLVAGGLANREVAERQYPIFRRDPLTAYVSELRSRPALAGLLGEAVIADRLRGTAALPTFFQISSGPGWALAGDAGHHKDPVIARGIADAFRDADLIASAVTDGWPGDLDAALAQYGRQRDQCAIPLSDANLGIARLDMAARELGAAWIQMTELEQALDDPAAVSG